jgi:hypothetical protein
VDHTLVDVKSLKSLEDLKDCLLKSIGSLITLHEFQVRAVEIGIMKEDMNERSNTIAWDLRRLIKMYREQLYNVLELLPDSVEMDETLKKFQKDMKKESRKLKEEK